MSKQSAADMDGGWKQVIDDFLEESFLFFFPAIHALIDFRQTSLLIGSMCSSMTTLADGICPWSRCNERHSDWQLLTRSVTLPVCAKQAIADIQFTLLSKSRTFRRPSVLAATEYSVQDERSELMPEEKSLKVSPLSLPRFRHGFETDILRNRDSAQLW